MGILRVMLKDTSDEQTDFICKELNITVAELMAMDEAALYDVYEAMTNIEIVEACKLSDVEEEISERGNVAADIITLWGNSMAEADGYYVSQDLEEHLEELELDNDIINKIVEKMGSKVVHMRLLMDYLYFNSDVSKDDIFQVVDDIFNEENEKKEKLRCEVWECLLTVSDANYDFVKGISSTLVRNTEWEEAMIAFLKANPEALVSDCVGFVSRLDGMHGERTICPICGLYFFDEPDCYDVCPVCYWEDDPLQRDEQNYKGGANKMSVMEGREAYRRSEKTL